MVELVSLLDGLPREHWITVILVAIVIAPWIVRWRQRLRLWLRRLSLIAVGIVIGIAIGKYQYVQASSTVFEHHRTALGTAGFLCSTGSAVVSGPNDGGPSQRSCAGH